MTITAKIIVDSTNDAGIRLTTMELRYPRFIHAELMTHRVFSRNASSSRAIPVQRLIDDVLRDTAMPIHWGKNQPGMQAHAEHDEPICVQQLNGAPVGAMTRQAAWLHARDQAVNMARRFDAAGYHKQIVNRLLEPFSHINVLVTATDWDNFYQLRRHKGAQPEIQALANAMWDAQQASTPEPLREGEWHLPYVDISELAWLQGASGPTVGLRHAVKASVARCARVSYLTHDGKKPDVEADLALYERLVGSVPLHASPAEHQATPWIKPVTKFKSNFHPTWAQYRKFIEAEILENY